MRISIIIIIFLISVKILPGQSNILNRPDILSKVERCLYATYGCQFIEANRFQNELEQELPQHPAPHFLKALIIYWENFPLLPEDPKVSDFENSMIRSIELSQPMIESREGNMEGIFFDMHARAFKGMFWADNGKVTKVLPDLNTMYRSTLKGISYKEQFNEFYFSSALYNYYIEAYIEKHPIYKPVIKLFRPGSKTLGLIELQYAIDSTTYIKYEALLFMALIQLNYEKNLNYASDYMAVLYNNFPENIYYLGQYLIILLHNKQYEVASLLSAKIEFHQNDFHKMIYSLSEGFLEEKQKRNLSNAKEYYYKTIAYAEKFGTIADLYSAIAYAGLSRILTAEKDEKLARKYYRISSQLSVYDYILE